MRKRRKSEPEVYAARLKDRKALEKSSSGGVFTALSDAVLEAGGAVAAAVYDYNRHEMTHRLVTDRETRDTARGSKYMQGSVGTVYRDSETWLKKNPGKELLFVGTGCQADAFRKYMEIRRMAERVYFIDIICHGTGSPGLWKKYAESLEEVHGGKMTYLTFKDKRNGWNAPYAYAEIAGKEVPVHEYKKLYSTGTIMRPACYACPYTTVYRKTDITIGDYWGIERVQKEFYSCKGNSLVLVHSERGVRLLKKAERHMELCKSTIKACLQPNLKRPTKCRRGGRLPIKFGWSWMD